MGLPLRYATLQLSSYTYTCMCAHNQLIIYNDGIKIIRTHVDREVTNVTIRASYMLFFFLKLLRYLNAEIGRFTIFSGAGISGQS